MAIQEKDRIECAIRHIQTAVDIDPWAVEIAVEAMKTQLSAEGTTSDLISRQEALDALIALTVYSNKRDLVKEADNHPNTWIEGVAECIDEIEDMPSAQPDVPDIIVGDMISRQDAIDALMDFDKKLRKINWYQYPHTEYECRGVDEAIVKIENVPSAHPEIEERKEESAQNVPIEDLISRKAAIDALMEIMDRPNHAEFLYTDEICKTLNELPSAQPEMNMDEWCTDCKEYDHEKHCCPRWNRVIRQTLKDAQPEPQWIPVSERLTRGRNGCPCDTNILRL